MRLGGRISAAIEVLTEIAARHRPASEALKDWGTAHRFAGSGDRGAIGNVVYDALRRRSSSAWIMGSDAPRAAVLAVLTRQWAVPLETLRSALAEDAHGPGPLTDAEAQHLAAADLAAAPPHARADIPEWLAPAFARQFGDDWVAEGEGFAARPPLDLRANTLKADRAKVLKALARFAATETAYAPNGVRIAATTGEGRHPNVEVEPAFQKGWFEVQDEGSQVAAALAGARPGIQVLDLCAGAGGKSLALAAAMGGKGRLVATDSDRSRLAPIFDRAKRAAAHNIEVRAAGAPLDDLAGRMDIVLVDAPCTGTGSWRRRPDSKWRVTDRALATRLAEQRVILREAARFVKAGGRLVYITCSVLPDENADQVVAFLQDNTAFAAIPPTQLIGGAAVGILGDAAQLGASGITLTPRRTGTDGFFIAGLTRQ